MGASQTVRLWLLGGFELRVEEGPVELAVPSQRVLGALALLGGRDGWLAREVVAGALWGDHPVKAAGTKLRNALWRIRQSGADAFVVKRDLLALAPHVDVDVHRVVGGTEALPGSGDARCGETIRMLSSDLLPTWDEDWLLMERERLRQVRLHALERLSSTLRADGRHAEAIDAALAAVSIEPLRESAQTALLEAHLAEGNVSEAVRQYRRYTQLLEVELGVPPGEQLRSLVAGAGGH